MYYAQNLNACVKPNGEWYFQNQRVLFTYKTHLNKADYMQWIHTITKIPKVEIHIAHETADQACPYIHTHVLIDFGKRFQTRNVRFFDYNEIHPHIAPVRSGPKNWKRTKHYLSKEDPECAYCFDHTLGQSLVERIHEQKTLIDALKVYAQNPNDVSGIITLYNLKGQSNDHLKYEQPTYQWQIDLLEMCEAPPDKEQTRKVIWYYDDIGNTGKSQLCRYLGITRPNEWYIIKSVVSYKDLGTIITSALSGGWSGHGVIFDIPRADVERELASGRDMGELYRCIEVLKDGSVTAQKYNGSTSFFNIPWVVVMSNGWPDVYRLSRDRWDIRRLNSDKTADKVHWEMVPNLRNEYVTLRSQRDDQPCLPTNAFI